jgi:enoyl-CoA hydratase/carnithine racemase
MELAMPSARVTVEESLGLSGIRRLTDAIVPAVADPAVRLVILEGEGPAFCRGLDFGQLVGDAADRTAAVDAFAECLQTLSLAGKPTLARVAGPALGGGVGLAAACDVVLAEETASFGLPELLLGLMPATILPVLLGRMTAQHVRLWVLQGKTYDAATACALGLVDEVIATGEAEASCRRWERTLSRANPRALTAFKRLLAEETGRQASAIRRGAALTAAALSDEAIVGSLRAFWLDGTPPWEER